MVMTSHNILCVAIASHSASVVNVYYTLTLNDFLVLNPAVNPVVDIDLIVTNIGLITSPSGVGYGVLTLAANVSVVRRSEALITVLEGAFSRLDWAYVAGLAQTLIIDVGGSKHRSAVCFVSVLCEGSL